MSDKVLIYKYDDGKGESTTISASFNKDKLVIEGCDTGRWVRDAFGDWDYEYFLCADKVACPSNIMEILKDGFQSFAVIRRWFDEHHIEYDIISYA